MTRWQKAVPADGNVALVMENHDLVRSINRFGSLDKYWKESAKCLALINGWLVPKKAENFYMI
ncbi:hypothetical protein GCM10023142_19100 [Anaerocolumna aminovalerica]|uniref:alpha-amylase family glycosyl hydrolase n=1 Tax=Anaerocolumna aminovalerica TaxID=1527 RepID=UPI000B85546C|nr:alpha-amylase family glycosyl hydrolase [Anaerocolumna aminovalerica]